jgi:hypothetical protein
MIYMAYVIAEATIEGLGNIKITPCDVDSPREWDNLGTFLTWESRCYSPDKNRHSSPRDFLEYMVEYLFDKSTEYVERKSNEQLLNMLEKKLIILPVYKYEHSGVVYNTTGFSCRWDSGQVGLIYVSKEELLNEVYANTRKRVSKVMKEHAEKIMKAEVEVYSQYANGEVYHFEIEDENENHVDSCGGFFGLDYDTNGMKDHIEDKYYPLLEKL